MQIDTNIQFTPYEQKLLSIIKDVIKEHTPSTEAFLVGGIVRDKLIGIPSNDIDIMLSNISGEDFAKLLTQHMGLKDPHIIRSNPEKSKFITTAVASIMINNETQEIDFAQARSEIYPENSRIPELKPATPQEDAHRRDLTINSLFYDIVNNKIVDFTGKGLKDLVTDTIRTPTEPLKTFSDDPLRIFRVIRFTAKYNGNIDPETYQAMQDPSLRDTIKQKISKERIGIEISKMLKNPNAEYAIQLMKNTGLWDDIIAEALKGSQYEGKLAPLDMEQNNPHHKLTIWAHTMEVVKNIIEKYKEADPEKRITMILAALMHDLGKTYLDIQVPSKNYPERTSYLGHEDESKKMAEYILRYLKLEPYIQQVAGMARYHMRPHKFTEENVNGIRAMRRFLRQIGEQSLNWLDVFNLAAADAMAKDVNIDPEIVSKYQNLETQLQDALISLKPIEDSTIPPILNGNEVMQILNIKPGAHMKEIMEFVKELKDENPDISKEEASERLIQQFNNISPENIKNAGKNKNNTGSTCPMPLLKQRIEQINESFKSKKYYEAISFARDLKNNYGNDDQVTRLVTITMYKLLLKDQKYRDNNFLTYIFKKAEKNFFDPIICPYTVGILLLINTNTEDEIIKNIGNRMTKMSPGILRSVLDMLPDKIERPALKKNLEEILK